MIRMSGDVLTLEDADLGPIQTPIRAAQAKRLIGLSRPARAWRLWWCYGPDTDTITLVTVGPHP